MSVPDRVQDAREYLEEEPKLYFGDPVAIASLQTLLTHEEMYCGFCDGEGQHIDGRFCSHCSGRGVVWVYVEPEL